MKPFFFHIRIFILVFNFLFFSVLPGQNAADLDSLWQIHNNKSNHDSIRTKVLDKIVYIYSNINPDSAISIGKMYLQKTRDIKMRRLEASALNVLGAAYNNKGDHLNALTSYQESLRIRDELKDERSKAITYQNIGNVYNSQKNSSEALRYFKMSYRLKEKFKMTKSAAITLNSIGTAYLDMGKPDSAIYYSQKAIDIFKTLDDKKFDSTILLNMGNALISTGKTKEALSYYEESLPMRIADGDVRGMARTYSLIGNGYNVLKNYSEGLKNCSKALELSIQSQTLDNQVYCYMCLGDAYAGKGDYKNAQVNYKRYATLKDTIFNEDRIGEISKKEAEFAFSKKALEDSLKNDEEKKIKDLAIAEKNAIITKDKTQFYALFGGIALLTVLAVVILFALRQKQKANILISRQKEETQKQNELIGEKNKNILDSINYAKRIQDAILPSEQAIKSLLPDSFVLFMPKDIVSGDFYFIEPIRMNDGTQLIGFAAADCTGHGVPGAFMSIIGTNILSHSLKQKEVNSPGEALDYLNTQLNIALRQREKDQQVRDGMDITFCVLIPSKLDLYFAGANNPAYVMTGGELVELKGDKQPVGYYEKQEKFTTRHMKLQKGDCVYLFSDGYADQFGGPKGKKFKYQQFKEKLIDIQHRGMEEQKKELRSVHIAWKGELEQVDDILIIGVRV